MCLASGMRVCVQPAKDKLIVSKYEQRNGVHECNEAKLAHHGQLTRWTTLRSKANFFLANFVQPNLQLNLTLLQRPLWLICWSVRVTFRQINAFIYDATVLEYLASHDDRCKLRTVGNWYATTGYGLGFPRGSKWISVVNKYLSQLQHNGEWVTKRSVNKSFSWFVKDEPCMHENNRFCLSAHEEVPC